MGRKIERKCVICDDLFVATRRDAFYCSGACRQKALRERKKREMERFQQAADQASNLRKPEPPSWLARWKAKAKCVWKCLCNK
jgi:predicted secreted protein